MRLPSNESFERLLILGNGAIVITPRTRDWSPLLRRGWVEAAWKVDHAGLPPLRITPDGLRALADWVERVGQPEIPRASERDGGQG